MKVLGIFKEKLNNLIKRFYFLPFPIIDELPDDISEYLQINKSELMESIKTGNFKKMSETFHDDYNKWLEINNYYFYDLCNWHLQGKFSFILMSLFQPKNLNILDFGSGIGTRALIYSKKNKITLVEINKKMLDFSKWRFMKYDRKADFYTELPKNKKFDMILLIDVIGHLIEPIKHINQICSSLKKNGILEVTFDNFFESSKGYLHRNKEIDFHKLFEERGLIKLDSLHYKKIKNLKKNSNDKKY